MSKKKNALGQCGLTISLAAITANWRLLAKLAHGAECSAVVKADAYGCGMGEVAPALYKAGCKTFFVALPSEGMALRALLKDAVIYVFNGLPLKSQSTPHLSSPLSGGRNDSADLKFPPPERGRVRVGVESTEQNAASLFQKHNLRPILNSPEEVKEWLGGFAALPFALHFDTCINRLGIKPENLSQLPVCEPALVMSHFVSSEIADDPLNRKQIDAFNAVRAKFPKAKASLANSSGIFLKEKPFYDLVRPGYALYGGNPAPGQKNPMRDVVTLQAPVIQMNDVKKGGIVGYNGQWTAKRDSRIATLSLGYADGILRSGYRETGQGMQVFWDGALHPVAGRVSMDLITVDVTEAKTQPKRGDFVEIIGPHLPIDDVAASMKTNGYEVLTSLGRRYERHYI